MKLDLKLRKLLKKCIKCRNNTSTKNYTREFTKTVN